MSIRSFLLFFQEERSNNAQSSPSLLHTLEDQRLFPRPFPHINQGLEPRASSLLPLPRTACTAVRMLTRVYSGCTQGGILGMVHREVYTHQVHREEYTHLGSWEACMRLVVPLSYTPREAIPNMVHPLHTQGGIPTVVHPLHTQGGDTHRCTPSDHPRRHIYTF